MSGGPYENQVVNFSCREAWRSLRSSLLTLVNCRAQVLLDSMKLNVVTLQACLSLDGNSILQLLYAIKPQRCHLSLITAGTSELASTSGHCERTSHVATESKAGQVQV